METVLQLSGEITDFQAAVEPILDGTTNWGYEPTWRC